MSNFKFFISHRSNLQAVKKSQPILDFKIEKISHLKTKFTRIPTTNSVSLSSYYYLQLYLLCNSIIPLEILYYLNEFAFSLCKLCRVYTFWFLDSDCARKACLRVWVMQQTLI